MTQPTKLADVLLASTEVVNATFLPPAKRIGEVLDAALLFVFTPLLKSKVANEHSIDVYKKEIAEKVNSIPSENLVEPPLNIVGPALEASKYYIESDEIRAMFSNLIASSANNTNNQKIHPSFVEIIKQMSPLDAIVCTFLFENEKSFGVGNIQGIYSKPNSTNGLKTSAASIVEHFFPLPNLTVDNYKDYQASITNLIRLGLIDITYNRSYVANERYTKLLEHPLYISIQDRTKVEALPDNFLHFDIQKGCWSFTAFGNNFTACCL
ncbi:DUF4393 domain-containing protein [Paenibacillus sp. ACRRX]|uniref:DUF4393 domain-containing protein n=1 Tax=Paenibacillus sp. ACRRX TaxID=2918206 RepID=UPI001EF494AA|nr:DUF4393 domain-containing protein [Paenibacillus sp. ACRRX]MCG7406739.1 DUF4393 domain-containing protein [Paenibacillus sp. ACRRX]